MRAEHERGKFSSSCDFGISAILFASSNFHTCMRSNGLIVKKELRK